MSGMLKSVLTIIAAYLLAALVALGVGYAVRAEHPLVILGAADLAATIVVFAFSVVTKNSSCYDPYWSVAPVPIALFWLLWPGSAGLTTLSHILIFALLCLWAARLTYNWASQWHGLSHEDWRYRDMQQQTGKLYWPVSFLGIHLMPTLLVFLGCLALWPALSGGPRSFSWLDAAAAIVTAAAIVIEATADLQMRHFRRTSKESGQTIPPGLWSYSRHPNYFGEVSFWWGLFLFALAADPAYWWTIIGPICILALFLFVSIPLMEKHLLQRRSGYAEYQRRVSAFVPWWRKQGTAG